MFLINVILLFGISLSFRYILELTGQSWIKTKSHTATLSILPFVTFVITKVISGNIALSLGMVGALSIVRFRNPVRSPLELTLYFTAITMGITASVNTRYLLFLAFCVYIISLMLFLISFISKRFFRKDFFINSFSEGTSLCTLEIETSTSIKTIEDSIYLKSISFSHGENIKYLLASSEFYLLKNFIFSFKDNQKIIRYQLNEG